MLSGLKKRLFVAFYLDFWMGLDGFSFVERGIAFLFFIYQGVSNNKQDFELNLELNLSAASGIRCKTAAGTPVLR